MVCEKTLLKTDRILHNEQQWIQILSIWETTGVLHWSYTLEDRFNEEGEVVEHIVRFGMGVGTCWEADRITDISFVSFNETLSIVGWLFTKI